MRNEVIHIESKMKQVTDYWSPKIVEQLNDYHVKVAKFYGEFTWHDHEDTDEMFLVIKGTMKIMFRDKEVNLVQGDIYVVPKGVEHKPIAETECHVLLIEPSGTINTGDVLNDQTALNVEWL